MKQWGNWPFGFIADVESEKAMEWGLRRTGEGQGDAGVELSLPLDVNDAALQGCADLFVL